MISVIVPIYNGEKYLEDTLQSLKTQSLSDFEVIMVDDGSTDNSPEIIKRFEDSDSRFHVVRRGNGGLSAARNTGLDHARGEWIYFIDADDTARHDALETLLSIAEKESVKMVIGGYFEAETEKWPTRNLKSSPEVHSNRDILHIALYQKRRINSSCGVLFSSELFKSERFTEGLYYEDLDIFPRLCLNSELIAYVSEPLYFYRQHQQSFIHTFTPRRLDSLIVTNRIIDFVRKNFPDLEAAARDRRMSAAFNVLLLLEKHRPIGLVPAQYFLFGTTYAEIGEYCYNIIKQTRRRSLLDPSVRLKNKVGTLLSFGGRSILRFLARQGR